MKMKEFLKKFPLIIGILSFVILKIGLKVMPKGTGYGGTIGRLVVVAICILVMWPVVGNLWLKFPGGGWKEAFKSYFYALIILAVGAIAMTVYMLFINNNHPDNLVGKFISIFLYCLSVGIVEEVVFRRGLFYTAVLQFPKMKNKAMWMAVISSFIFGFVHVMNDLSWDATAIVSALGKTVVTGSFGFIMCASLLDGKNLWASSLIHGLNDFFPMTLTIFMGITTVGSYVNTSAGGKSPVIELLENLWPLLISVPAIIISVKSIRKYDIENNCTE